MWEVNLAAWAIFINTFILPALNFFNPLIHVSLAHTLILAYCTSILWWVVASSTPSAHENRYFAVQKLCIQTIEWPFLHCYKYHINDIRIIPIASAIYQGQKPPIPSISIRHSRACLHDKNIDLTFLFSLIHFYLLNFQVFLHLNLVDPVMLAIQFLCCRVSKHWLEVLYIYCIC